MAIIIDANDTILGRMAAVAAKKALLGETVNVINAEKAVITGEPKKVLAEYLRMRNMGAPLMGPYYPRTPERIVKRTIRGMLPHKKTRGIEALARVKCYVGVPEEFKGKPTEKLSDSVHVNKTHAKFTTIKQISKHLGARVE